MTRCAPLLIRVLGLQATAPSGGDPIELHCLCLLVFLFRVRTLVRRMVALVQHHFFLMASKLHVFIVVINIFVVVIDIFVNWFLIAFIESIILILHIVFINSLESE
jgi:hypothetical protein